MDVEACYLIIPLKQLYLPKQLYWPKIKITTVTKGTRFGRPSLNSSGELLASANNYLEMQKQWHENGG